MARRPHISSLLHCRNLAALTALSVLAVTYSACVLDRSGLGLSSSSSSSSQGGSGPASSSSSSSSGQGGAGNGGDGGSGGIAGMGGDGGIGGVGGMGGMPPLDISGSVTGGAFFGCISQLDGSVFCWGDNTLGQIAGSVANPQLAPQQAPMIADVVKVQGGSGHVCALRSDRTVHCVGTNSDGQLGDGSFSDSTSFVQVVGISNAIDLSVGENHSCVVRASGTVSCWGLNEHDNLGVDDGEPTTLANSNVPINVVGLPAADPAVQVSASEDNACAVLTSGVAYCWGFNNHGQLGNGMINNVADGFPPVQVSGLSNITQISAGTGYSCAVTGAGTTHCWGVNTYGQLGIGVAGADVSTATPVTTSAAARSVTASWTHTCATLIDDTAQCWGRNTLAKLGINDAIDLGAFPTPQTVVDSLNVTFGNIERIGSGVNHSCAQLKNNSVVCWGSNQVGQLGTNMTVGQQPFSAVPTATFGL